MVKDQVGECAKGESKAPSLAITEIKITSKNGDEDEEEKRVTEYPATTEGFPEEELPHRFINDVRQKRPYEEEPDIGAAG